MCMLRFEASSQASENINQKISIQLLDSLSNIPISFAKIDIKEYNSAGDSLKTVGITNKEGILTFTISKPATLYFQSTLYGDKAMKFTPENFPSIKIFKLVPLTIELAEVLVKERSLHQVNVVEIRMKTPIKSLAPINRNFLKTVQGIHLIKGSYTYLGKKIIYFIDGVSVEEKIILEAPTNSFEKAEILLSSVRDYWLKPNEVAINFISKKVKNPTWGLQLTGEVALGYPYRSQNIGLYYLGNKFSFRASVIDYSYNSIIKKETFQTINNLSTKLSQVLNNKTHPNFNSIIMNYSIDSLSSFAYHWSYQKINHFTEGRFNFQELTFDPTPSSTFASNNRSQEKDNFGNLILYQRPNHKLFFRYDYGFNNNQFTYSENNVEKQSVNFISNATYFNYSNQIKLSDEVNLNSNFSWENKNAKTNFINQVDPLAFSQFFANFFGVKSILAFSLKEISIVLGGRVDLINQDFKSPTIRTNRKNQFRFLPTFSMQYESEKFGAFNFSLNNDYTLPDISQLATFTRRVDPYKSLSGNNALYTENTFSFDFTHSLEIDPLSLSTVIQYERVKDYLGYSPFVQNNTQLARSYANLGNVSNWDFQLDASLQISKKLSTQFNFSKKFIKFSLDTVFREKLPFVNWVPSYSVSQSFLYQLSDKVSASLDLYIEKFTYDYFDKKTVSVPNVNVSINSTLGKNWYFVLNWDTVFLNGNFEKSETRQSTYRSITSEISNFRYLSVSIKKTFGKKNNNVPIKSTSDEVKRKFKTI